MTTRILGIDPGSRVTGFAVLEHQNRKFRSICCEVIRLDNEDHPFDRLKRLYSEITSVISLYLPEQCAIETPVYGKNPEAMLKLGRAQAAIMMSILHHNLPLYEYYPKAIKKAITGTGNANKNQVAYMLHKLIDIPGKDLIYDATDALAVAWCHFQKLSDLSSPDQPDHPLKQESGRRNTWSSFVMNHPERVHKK